MTVEKSTGGSKNEIATTKLETGCFVCHGTGHWARECTSLPAIYLTDDAPKCYRCGGVGHFARFCPTSEKQCRIRERRASLPNFNYSDWPNCFGDVLNFAVPALTEPYYLVRPEYAASDSPTSFESIDADEILSDCSSVNYMIEDDAILNESEMSYISSKDIPVEIASFADENKKSS